MPLRLVMMGTGTFAVPTFLKLYESDHEVVGLFTQPDRTGRGHHRHRNPLKEAAIEHDTPVFQPQSAKTPEAIADLRSLDADLCVVAAYGQILSAELLAVPRLGAINLHGSLLPKYRGAAPVQYAVWHGEAETGITIFQIEPKLDAGAMLGVVSAPIGNKETSGQLMERLGDLAVDITLNIVNQLSEGTAQPLLQNADEVTLAPMLKKSDGLIDWTQTASRIECQIRAMQPWPKAYTFLKQGEQTKRLIVLDADPVDLPSDCLPGDVIQADAKTAVVQTGNGALELKTIQPEGKRPLKVSEYQCGQAITTRAKFVND
ncbi:MAG: methionyl-tRNA formyltransferase [Planctomycetaceae bacterium]|nr:methionyl-tRNA formyltransferase [Planctomycetaceae bacterium]